MLVPGSVRSLCDYLTFGMMLWVFDAWDKPSLFQTGWFVASLLTQSLIIHLVRTQKIPFLQSRASWPLRVASGLICAVGIVLPATALGKILGFTPLAAAYWPLLALILLTYARLAHWARMQFVRRWGR